MIAKNSSMTEQPDKKIEISIVMPCLNEEATLAVCIQKARAAMRKMGVSGEIIIADNGSTDASIEIAQSLGSRVVHQPIRGYGAAYLAGLGQARGKYLVMGDSDDTYDFSDLGKFIAPLKNGYDLVMGSRLKGKILPKAMPWTHRYIGNPILTGILNLLFHAKVSDAHCGMRAFTKKAYEKMQLQTTGMEFASEMVIKAAKAGLKITEIPITYYPRAGKSKLHPYRDAWRHMRFMLLYSPTYLFFAPGALLFVLGLLVTLLLLSGPLVITGRSYDIHVMILASLLALLGFQVLALGLSARTYALIGGFEIKDSFIEKFYRYFSLEKGILLGATSFLIGFGIDAKILYQWISSDFEALNQVRMALLALVLMVLGAQTVFTSFFLSMLSIDRQSKPR